VRLTRNYDGLDRREIAIGFLLALPFYLAPVTIKKSFLVRRTKRRELQEITKEVVGIHVLLTRLFFGGGILRMLLLRVSLAKPTSAPLRF
jgi:hypothetical protein